MVRVAGYSAYFVQLTKRLQGEIYTADRKTTVYKRGYKAYKLRQIAKVPRGAKRQTKWNADQIPDSLYRCDYVRRFT